MDRAFNGDDQTNQLNSFAMTTMTKTLTAIAAGIIGGLAGRPLF